MFKGSALAAVAVVVMAAIGAAASAQDARPQIAQAPAAPAVLATGQDNDNPDLRCDILEVRRVSGGALSIRWRMVNTAGTGQAGLTGSGAPTPIKYTFHWAELYYIDPAENKKYMVITDPNNDRVAGIWEGDLAPGQQRLSWAKFAAPPPSSTKISFTISGFAPFEDLPISQ
jgi:hypothetical protein